MGVEQNRAATKPSIYLAWRLSIIREAGEPPRWLKPTPRKPSIYLAWRLSIIREAGEPPRWAEAHPAQTLRLSRLAAFQRSRGGRRRPGGLKPILRKPSVYLAWRRAQYLPRLAAFQRSQNGRHRPGGLKRCCSRQSAWVFFLRWVLFWQKETRVLRVSWFALCCVFLSSDGQIYCNRNLP